MAEDIKAPGISSPPALQAPLTEAFRQQEPHLTSSETKEQNVSSEDSSIILAVPPTPSPAPTLASCSVASPTIHETEETKSETKILDKPDSAGVLATDDAGETESTHTTGSSTVELGHQPQGPSSTLNTIDGSSTVSELGHQPPGSIVNTTDGASPVPAYRPPGYRANTTDGASPVPVYRPPGYRVRPNAFVAARIPSLLIREGLRSVQEAVVKYDRRLKDSLTSLDKLHLTLLVLNLPDNEDIERYGYIRLIF